MSAHDQKQRKPHTAEPFGLFLYGDQRNTVHKAIGQNEIAIRRDRRVAHDVAAARDCPALKFRRLGIEAHDGIRSRAGLAVPDDIVDRRDAVRLSLRPTRRLPLGYLAGRWIETTEKTARKVGVPDDIVTGDCDAPRAGGCIRQRIFTKLQSLRIDAAHLVGTKFNEEYGAF